MVSMVILYLILGLCLGSFFSVIGVRWGLEAHETRKWWSGRSQCDTCGKTLKWYELIPVFSYLFQGGKCRSCKAKIPIKPFLCELMCGIGWIILGIYSYKFFLLNPCDVLVATIAMIYLSFAATTDFISHCIEGISGYIAILALIVIQIYSHINLPSVKAYAIISVAAFVLSVAAERFNRDSIVGNGDIQCLLLLFFAGGYININGFLSILFYSAVCAGIAAIVLMLAKKGKTAVAVVPFFYFGYLLLLSLGSIQFFWERRL